MSSEFDSVFNKDNLNSEIEAQWENPKGKGKGKSKEKQEAEAAALRSENVSKMIRTAESRVKERIQHEEQRRIEDEREKEHQEKKNYLKELEKWFTKYQVKPSKPVSSKSELIDIELAHEEVGDQVSVLKGHQMLKGLTLTSAGVLENLSSAYPGYLKLKGMTGILAKKPELDTIIAELCVEWGYLFKEISPTWQLAGLVALCAVEAHAANSTPEVMNAVKTTESLRDRLNTPISLDAKFDHL